jgi:hypothetical protein
MFLSMSDVLDYYTLIEGTVWCTRSGGPSGQLMQGLSAVPTLHYIIVDETGKDVKLTATTWYSI